MERETIKCELEKGVSEVSKQIVGILHLLDNLPVMVPDSHMNEYVKIAFELDVLW